MVCEYDSDTVAYKRGMAAYDAFGDKIGDLCIATYREVHKSDFDIERFFTWFVAEICLLQRALAIFGRDLGLHNVKTHHISEKELETKERLDANFWGSSARVADPVDDISRHARPEGAYDDAFDSRRTRPGIRASYGSHVPPIPVATSGQLRYPDAASPHYWLFGRQHITTAPPAGTSTYDAFMSAFGEVNPGHTPFIPTSQSQFPSQARSEVQHEKPIAHSEYQRFTSAEAPHHIWSITPTKHRDDFTHRTHGRRQDVHASGHRGPSSPEMNPYADYDRSTSALPQRRSRPYAMVPENSVYDARPVRPSPSGEAVDTKPPLTFFSPALRLPSPPRRSHSPSSYHDPAPRPGSRVEASASEHKRQRPA